MRFFNINLPTMPNFTVYGAGDDAVTEWKVGDRFRGTGTGRLGIIVRLYETKVQFLMDDSPTDGICDRSMFEKHAERIGRAAHTDPAPPAEAACATCGRTNDVGVRTCWCCGGAPALRG